LLWKLHFITPKNIKLALTKRSKRWFDGRIVHMPSSTRSNEGGKHTSPFSLTHIHPYTHTYKWKIIEWDTDRQIDKHRGKGWVRSSCSSQLHLCSFESVKYPNLTIPIIIHFVTIHRCLYVCICKLMHYYYISRQKPASNLNSFEKFKSCKVMLTHASEQHNNAVLWTNYLTRNLSAITTLISSPL
jgi:hypothetical protein